MLRPLVALLVVALPLTAAPVPKALKAKAPSVAGTSWQQLDDSRMVTYTFEANGRLSYRIEGNHLNRECGSWKQDGDKITWDTHNHYADYEATFADGAFEGTAKSVEGKTWKLTLRPAEK